jgi:ferredoxin-NADP reductase
MEKVTIKEIEPLNHNVRRIVAEKPVGYSFEPGQATMVAIDKEGLREEKRPFTFTSLPIEDRLEFTIKVYPAHEGVTDAVDDLKAGDALLIEEAWGAIKFQGPGVFIAGGAGVTPMLSILREQKQERSGAVNKLIFANSTEKDLFLADELAAYVEGEFIIVFSQEAVAGAHQGRVDQAFLQDSISDFAQNFYVCGPPKMVEDVTAALKALGADSSKIVTEES